MSASNLRGVGKRSVESWHARGEGDSRAPIASGRPGAVPRPDIRCLGAACTYPPGAIILRQGEPARILYLIQEGVVKLVRAEANGRQVLVGFRAAGWLLGVAAAILAQPLPVSAETVTVAELRSVHLDQFVHLQRTDLSVAVWLGQVLAMDLYEQTVRLGELAVLDPRARLVRLLQRLLTLHPVTRSDGTVQVSLALTHQDLADAIGVSRETMTRLLARLERDGVICRDKGWLDIPRTSPLLRSPSIT